MEFFFEKIIGTKVAKAAIKAVAAINKRGYKSGTFKNLKNGISIRLPTEIFLHRILLLRLVRSESLMLSSWHSRVTSRFLVQRLFVCKML